MCSVDGCEKPPRRASADLCAMHYHRRYRHGDVNATATRLHTAHGRRYRSLHLPGHPLAGASGRVYAHRVALWDKIGPGSHACHWCGVTVEWGTDLQADHLNAIGDDNRPANLVPSCRSCNGLRAAQSRHVELVALGYWSGSDTVAKTGSGRKPAIASSF